MLIKLVNRLSGLLFPNNCVLCRQSIAREESARLCAPCQNSLEFNKPPFCPKCSRTLEDPRLPVCWECRERPPCFDRAWSACVYNPPMRRLTHLFKYGHKTGLRHEFFQTLIAFIETYRLPMDQFDLIIPVPLHAVRLRERGYNQAELLSGALARHFQIPHAARNLIRIRHTRNQAALSQKERWTNIEAAFKISNPSEIDGKSILIIDDLMTTGATLSEIARVLKEANAKNVTALTLAVAA